MYYVSHCLYIYIPCISMDGWMDRYTPHVSRAYHSVLSSARFSHSIVSVCLCLHVRSLAATLCLARARTLSWAVLLVGACIWARSRFMYVHGNRIAFLLLDNVQRAIGDLNDYDFDNFEATLCDFIYVTPIARIGVVYTSRYWMRERTRDEKHMPKWDGERGRKRKRACVCVRVY